MPFSIREERVSKLRFLYQNNLSNRRYRKNAIEMWTYRCYDDGSQPNLWRRWYDANPDYQGTHDATFQILEMMQTWKPPKAKSLGKDLIEVRLSGRVMWRILGFYGSERRQFVVVGACNHKGKVYEPKEALNTARRMIKEIKAGKKVTVPCERPQ